MECIVTGGASGLGAAVARRLAGDGASVTIVDLDGARAADVAASLPGVAAVAADVTDEAAFGAVVASVAEREGGLGAVVHCAGIARPERVLGRDGAVHDLGRFRRIVEVNLVGTFNVARLAAAAMARRPAGPDGERGVIVLTSSIAAFDGQAGQAAYAAAKGGVAALALPMARDLARHGIRVVAIAPGMFATEMLQELSDEARRALEAQVPFPRRLGAPDEFAALVAHVIANPMLNGETIRLDGALRLGYPA
jgi:NAD(P)-dependent dehydrogenase (short-subunit alcohol dehydrogenase family)